MSMRLGRLILCFIAALALGSSLTGTLGAQAARAADTTRAAEQPLRAYLDCQTMGCDRDFFITEIAFVNWTRDRADADIHVLVTSLVTGSGGIQFSTQFIGQKRFASHADTIVTSVPPNSTDDASRRALARAFKLVLVRYASATSAAAHLDVSFDAPVQASATAAKAHDPWDFWVYRVSSNGFFQGESQTSSANFSGNVNASRTTDTWKISVGANMNYRQSNYTFGDGTKSLYIQRSSGANFRLVRSLTDHWSYGINANAGRSEYNNQDFFVGGRASVEYNFFKWKEATAHQFVAIYAIGPTYNLYHDQTIYFKDRETLPQHQFILANTTKARWGSVDAAVSFSQYLQDLSKTNASLEGQVNINITKGLSLNIGGVASSVHDQLFLARGSLSQGDILTRQRALATSFSYFSFVGVSYTFGSIFNTIVNPRLDKLSGGSNFSFSF